MYDFIENINPHSLKIINYAKIEPSLLNAKIDEKYQFVRKGYFNLDKSSSQNKLIFNQSVALKDTWTKKQN